METTPFTYGKVAQSADFTNRTEELTQLKRNFNAQINTILISPRRWGKTSLIKKASIEAEAENKKLRICNLDIFNLRSEYEFYIALTNEVLKATTSNTEEIVQNAKAFLSRLVPRISLSPDFQTELSFGVSFDDIKRQPDEILDLAEQIAKKKKLQIVICIDEFQSVNSFENPEAFQKKLRAHWQNHTHVSYCLYGSKKSMLLHIFNNPAMPFYKFGDLIFLEKIKTKEWIPFICSRFSDTHKQITEEDAKLIVILADNHPYYVQQLSQQTWFRTAKKCNEAIVVSAFEAIIDQLSLLFANVIESFNSTQLNLLRAILLGETQLSAQHTLQKYRIGTSANATRIKRGLIENEIINESNGAIHFLDPMFKSWLETRFFKIK